MVSDVSISTALDQQSRTQASTASLAEDFSQFLNLLTIQLQNQDPLNPMDTNEFTNQIVAFTGVEQQINTNQKLDSLVSLQLNNAMGSALNYVGMDISYIGSEFTFDGQTPAKINYAFNRIPVDATLRVVDEGGRVIYEEDAVKSPGNNEFFWDGTTKDGTIAPEGTYAIRIDALDIDDNPVNSTAVVTGRVRGIETQNGLLFALVGDRAVSLGNVLNAGAPGQVGTTSGNVLDALNYNDQSGTDSDEGDDNV